MKRKFPQKNEKGKEMQKERERCYQPQLTIRQQLGLMNIRIALCCPALDHKKPVASFSPLRKVKSMRITGAFSFRKTEAWMGQPLATFADPKRIPPVR